MSSKITDEQIHNAVFRSAEALVRNINGMSKKTRLYDDLGMDSLDVTEFTMMIEEALDIRLPDDFIGDEDTLGDVVLRIQAMVQREAEQEQVKAT